MSAVGVNADLSARERSGVHASPPKLHGQQRDGDPLARRQQHVQFALIRRVGRFMRQLEQSICLAAHGREHHHDLMPVFLRALDSLSNTMNPFDIADRRPAVFLNNECHRSYAPRGKSRIMSLVASRGADPAMALSCS